MPAEELKYFITYTYSDSEFVIQLVKELRAAGANLWLDQLDILGGEHWDRAVEKALKSCKGMIAVLSPEAVASNNVMDEVSYALDEGKVVVPVLLRCCDVPLRLRRVHYVDFTTGYEKGFADLLRALHIEQPARPPGDSVPAAPAGHLEEPSEEISTMPESGPKDDRPPETPVRKHIGKLPLRGGESTPGEAFDDSKPTARENRKTATRLRTAEVIGAICIVMLVAFVSIKLFAKKEKEENNWQPRPGDTKTNSIRMNLVYIPAGSFMMGSTSTVEELVRDYRSPANLFRREFPRHEVNISRSFWMSQTEVTQAQYRDVMKAEPWLGKESVEESPDNPAVCVTWDDAAEFCRKLGGKEGRKYRLPTEAEWEYACRAGTTTRYSFGNNDSYLGEYAWFNQNTNSEDAKYPVHPVAKKKPNKWGLYDMHGNVWEWCSDWYKQDYYTQSPQNDPPGPPSGTCRAIRGGSAGLFPTHARCSFRDSRDPTSPIFSVGFRVVCTEP